MGRNRLTHFGNGLRIVSSHFYKGDRHGLEPQTAIADTPKVMTEGNWKLGVFELSGMFHPVAFDLTIAEAKRSRINAFGIEYEGKTGLSTSEFSWAA